MLNTRSISPTLAGLTNVELQAYDSSIIHRMLFIFYICII